VKTRLKGLPLLPCPRIMVVRKDRPHLFDLRDRGRDGYLYLAATTLGSSGNALLKIAVP